MSKIGTVLSAIKTCKSKMAESIKNMCYVLASLLVLGTIN